MMTGSAVVVGGWRKGFVTALMSCGLMFAIGCNTVIQPKPVPVKGTVIFRGKPLAKARVTFYAKGAPLPATGDTNDAGEFVLGMYGKDDGALVGENKVTVVSLDTSANSSVVMPNPADIASGKAAPDKATMPVSKTSGGGASTLPGLYGDAGNTPLTYTVKPEGNTDVKLELQ